MADWKGSLTVCNQDEADDAGLHQRAGKAGLCISAVSGGVRGDKGLAPIGQLKDGRARGSHADPEA